MKKIDLSSFPTDALKALQEQIKKEISSRKKSDSSMRRINFIHSLKPKDFPDREHALESIYRFNSENLLKIPINKGNEPRHLTRYLPCLLDQNWSELYPRETDIGEFYVYAHVDPRHRIFVASSKEGGNYGGQPFYIGKGIGNRAFDLKRNQGHGKTIKEILNDGYLPSNIVKILFSDLSEQKALEIEAKLIYYFGTKYSKQRIGWLVNLTEPITPEFIDTMKRFPCKNTFEAHQ